MNIQHRARFWKSKDQWEQTTEEDYENLIIEKFDKEYEQEHYSQDEIKAWNMNIDSFLTVGEMNIQYERVGTSHIWYLRTALREGSAMPYFSSTHAGVHLMHAIRSHCEKLNYTYGINYYYRHQPDWYEKYIAYKFMDSEEGKQALIEDSDGSEERYLLGQVALPVNYKPKTPSVKIP